LALTQKEFEADGCGFCPVHTGNFSNLMLNHNGIFNDQQLYLLASFESVTDEI